MLSIFTMPAPYSRHGQHGLGLGALRLSSDLCNKAQGLYQLLQNRSGYEEWIAFRVYAIVRDATATRWLWPLCRHPWLHWHVADRFWDVGVTICVPFLLGLVNIVVSYVLSFAGIFVLGLSMDARASTFGR